MVNRPRQQRSIQTRTRIISASLDVLVEHGYAGLTMQRVQDAAGVSRGALTNHFGSMAQLAAATVEDVANRQTSALHRELGRESGAAPEATVRTLTRDRLVDALVALIRQPTFVTGLELWGAARTDPELRAALAPEARLIGRAYRVLIAELLSCDPESSTARLATDGILSLLRGLALGAVLRDQHGHERRVLRQWLDSFA